MKVSVIMPTCRREWELKRALLSLASQSFQEFEAVVVNDNEDDNWNRGVGAIIEEVRQMHPDLTIVHVNQRKRLGSARARNLGIQSARGEFITFLDDDDEYLPEKIERQLAFMEAEALDYSITDLDLYYDDGHLSERRKRTYIQSTDSEQLFQYHLMHHMTGTDTLMFRKSFLERIHGFAPIDVGDEFYLIQRAIDADGKFGYLPRCDVKAYVHRGEGGLSSGESKITGEMQLYEHKKKYFHMLPANCVRYIKMRHYCVLAFAYLRMKKYGKFLGLGLRAVLIDPVQSVGLLLGRRA